MRKEIKTAFLAIGIILLLIAAACLALYFAWQGQIAEKERSTLLYVGIGCAVAAVVCVVISLCIKSQPQNKPPKSKEQPSLPSPAPSQQPARQYAQPSEQQYAQQTRQPEQQSMQQPPVDRLPQGAQPVPRQSPMLIHMGERQSTEEKFAEIAKMDKTQFVVYAARLFGYRGYRVKFTPVIDNYDVDLLVEKMGVTIAVGCVLSDKVLSAQDVAPVAEGRRYYHASAVMVVTNSYFDRSALDYAKQNNLSLVDRNVLSRDFM